jgi:hypothetical protein
MNIVAYTKSVLITPLFSKRRGDGEKLAAEVEKGVYEADLVLLNEYLQIVHSVYKEFQN